MSSFVSIRETSSSYDIYPIEEKEEDHEQFVPYAHQRSRAASQISDSLDFRRIGNTLSQSLDCKNRQPPRVRRCKTLHKEQGTTTIHFNKLEVNTSQLLLPLVIHSMKKSENKAQEKVDPKKSKLVKLQGEMKKHRPAFFKEKMQALIQNEEKPARVLHLDAARSNVFLFELKNRSKEQLRSDQISGKQLKKLMRVHKMQSSWLPIPPPPSKLDRPRHAPMP